LRIGAQRSGQRGGGFAFPSIGMKRSPAKAEQLVSLGARGPQQLVVAVDWGIAGQREQPRDRGE
jgi:hypothetical protein